MLVLSRKLNETIQIGDQITLRVVQIRGNRVRLGIEAPADVRVIRSELLEPTTRGATAAVEVEMSEADFEESFVVVPPFAAEAASDVMPPELMGDDADHWQPAAVRRQAARPRRQRMLMPEVSTCLDSVATAK